MTVPAAYQAGADQLAALLRDYYDTCCVNLHDPVTRRAVEAAHRYFHGLMAVLVAAENHLQAELVLHVVAATSLFGDSE